VWDLKVCIVGDKVSNEAMLVEICVGAAFHNLSSNIAIVIDGVSLTGKHVALLTTEHCHIL